MNNALWIKMVSWTRLGDRSGNWSILFDLVIRFVWVVAIVGFVLFAICE